MVEENMNQEISQEEMNLDNKELTAKEMKKIIEKIEKEGKEETKYFLRISLFVNKCHPEGTYRQTYSILYGEAKEINVYEYRDSCTEDKDIVIIPQSRNVIVMTYDGFGKPDRVYVFDFTRGWRSLYL